MPLIIHYFKYSTNFEQKERSLADTKALLERLQNSQKGLEAEVGTPLQSKLSTAEQAELETLNKDLTVLKQEAIALGQTRAQVWLI